TVVLREQMRVSDPVWRDFLRRLRFGHVEERDVTMLQSLVLTDPNCDVPDFATDPWINFALVTPRHGVRKEWNNAALEKHACSRATRIYVCRAEDRVGKARRSLTLPERYGVALRFAGKGAAAKKREHQSLPDLIKIAVGMKVMVTTNVETDLDITNGARGTIVDIVLHPDEPAHNSNDTEVELENLPLYILVKLQRTRA
ncbi:hypothetical protein DENSPDRAFT_744835, partial [Dentipellis sp. KUC8613]